MSEPVLWTLLLAAYFTLQFLVVNRIMKEDKEGDK